LRIVDGIVRLTPPAAQVDVGLALGTAQQRARNPHFRIAAIAAVHVLLERADDSLPIVVTAGRCTKHPIVDRGIVVRRPARRSLRAAIEDIPSQVDVEQVIPAQRIVQRQRGAALPFSGGLAAAVVERQVDAPSGALLPRDHQYALPRQRAFALGGYGTGVCGYRGYSCMV